MMCGAILKGQRSEVFKGLGPVKAPVVELAP